ncbi:hypothetical protein LX36DRAFT_189201 [Colletotrichum falcatum]|nr:hypothetical protein LX36DRAFT_189201 [Colletotrichum falcatum]
MPFAEGTRERVGDAWAVASGEHERRKGGETSDRIAMASFASGAHLSRFCESVVWRRCAAARRRSDYVSGPETRVDAAGVGEVGRCGRCAALVVYLHVSVDVRHIVRLKRSGERGMSRRGRERAKTTETSRSVHRARAKRAGGFDGAPLALAAWPVAALRAL